MTGNKCFLDPSVVIHFFKNNVSVVEILKGFQEIYVSTVVAGELFYGAYASSDPAKHITQIQSFLNNCIIVDSDIGSSIIYGQLKAILKKNGTPIPENDIWIAAIAAENKIPLFTTDNHFKLMELDLIDF